MITAAHFYTPEAETAEVLTCGRPDHLMSRETALEVGRQNHAQWGCPYCTRTSAERSRWIEHIRKIVDEAPPLTPEQRDKLALLLKGGTG